MEAGPLDETGVDQGLEKQLLRGSLKASLFGTLTGPVRIGRFVVLARIGAGGMGVVFSGYDEELDRKVAIKLLQRNAHDPDAAARLKREAQAMARLSHPNVIPVFEVGEYEQSIYVAMEFVAGSTLRGWVEGRTWPEILHCYLGAGRGLAAAHDAGIVHRDFKPDNVMVGEDERARVFDFGLARPGDRGLTRPAERGDRAVELDTPVTTTGAVLGTPAYMAPEQHEGRAVDARTDQFSFCVALWEALHGVRPFSGKTLAALGEAVLAGRIDPPPPETKVPRWVREHLERGMAVDPGERHPSMAALLGALANDPTRRRRQIAMYAGGALVVAAASTAGYLQNRSSVVCLDAEERLAGLWDAGRKQEVQRAIEGTGTAFAAATWHAVEREIDARLARWRSGHDETCAEQRRLGRATMGEELAARRACLDAQLEEVAIFAELMLEADPELIEGTLDALGELSPPGICTGSAPAVGAPVPSDPALRSKQARMQAQLYRGRVLTAMKLPARARPLTTAVLDEARAEGLLGVEAQALIDLVDIEGHERVVAAVITDQRPQIAEAFRKGLEADYGDVVARAAAWMAIESYNLGAPEEVSLWSDIAESAAKRGSTTTTRLNVHVIRSLKATLSGDPEVAVDEMELCFDEAAREQIRTLAHTCASNLALLTRQLDVRERGLHAPKKTVAWAMEQYGADHPNTWMLQRDQMAAELRWGNVAEADRLAEPLIAAAAVDGTRLYSLVEMYHAHAKFEAGLEIARKAVEAHGAGPARSRLRAWVGHLYGDLGEHDAAMRALQTVAIEELPQSDRRRLLADRAESLAGAGRKREAIEATELALETFPEDVITRNSAAFSFVLVDEPQRAIEVLGDVDPPDPVAAAVRAILLGVARWNADEDRENARSSVREGLNGLRDLDGVVAGVRFIRLAEAFLAAHP